MSGVRLDAGGLIALDRNDRQVVALIARATERGMRITIPATALAQAILSPVRQAFRLMLPCIWRMGSYSCSPIQVSSYDVRLKNAATKIGFRQPPQGFAIEQIEPGFSDLIDVVP